MIARITALLVFVSLLVVAGRTPVLGQSSPPGSSIPAAPVALENGGFECPDYVEGVDGRGNPIRVPAGWWTVSNSVGESPVIFSTREWYGGNCASDAWIEHLEGRDAVILRSQDLETPPLPGKPFDATLYQRVAVEPGGAYSVSGWFVSLCGGSFSDPNDCPDGYYMAKLLGLDPAGGTDPTGDGVLWRENRDNFVEPDGRTRIGWQNLRLAAVAEAPMLTVLARINSPFQWHGNHAFIDAIKIIRAPAAFFGSLPATLVGSELALPWSSVEGPDVAALGGTYRLYIDVQVRPEDGQWRDLLVDGTSSGTLNFQAPCTDTAYEFRIRARAEQPPADEAGEGVFPNHRFPGVWSEAERVYFQTSAVPTTSDSTLTQQSFLPLVFANREC
jgi:hypothetical protein